MKITERTVGDVTILDLQGRLVLEDGDQVFKDACDALVRDGHRKFLLNLEGVSFLDSAGVGAIVWKYVTIKKKGGALKLLRLSQRSHHVLLITRLLSIIETFDSETDAVQSFESTDRAQT